MEQMTETFKQLSARQRAFSDKTFTPGRRTIGICKHLQHECEETLNSRGDIDEWADILLLSLDGMQRVGWSHVKICRGLVALSSPDTRPKPKTKLKNRDFCIVDLMNYKEPYSALESFNEMTLIGITQTIGSFTTQLLKQSRQERVDDNVAGNVFCSIFLMALDGAMWSAYGPEEIFKAMQAKLTKNENRNWPTHAEQGGPDQAIMHTKGAHK